LFAQPDLDRQRLGELGGALFARGRLDLAAQLFEAWTVAEPAFAEAWNNWGLCLLRLRRINQAKQVLEHVLTLDPNMHAARNNLCGVYQALGEHQAQLQMALQAVQAQASSALAFNNLGTALQDNGLVAEAAHAFETSLMLDPQSFEAGFNLAKLAFDRGDNASAMTYLESALALPQPDVRRRELLQYHLSYAYLATGRLSEGWPLYEYGFSELVPATFARTPHRRFTAPRWEGQALQAHQTLMVWREQGIGDEIRFASLLPKLAAFGGNVIVECEPRLIAPLQRAFPQYQVRGQQFGAAPEHRQSAHDYDFHIPIGSLARYLVQERADFVGLGGFLQAEAEQLEKFSQRMAPYAGKKKVGICWRSHLLAANRNKKYTQLEDWRHVLSAPDTVFVNLQYGECEAELQAMEQALGISILRWPDVDLKQDLEAVFGIIAHLDLVISVSTAVVPMAGALGTPTLFLGHPTYLLLGETEVYPWFASVRSLLVPHDQAVAACLERVPAAMQTYGLKS
jgi:Flp pilus assembly protein TadD